MLQRFVFMMILLSFVPVAQAASNDRQLPQQLTGSDLEQATKMNEIYARHMYSSTCMERQKALYTPRTLSPAELSARMVKYKESCDCLTDVILKKFTPNDVIDYVTDRDGVFPPGVKMRPNPEPVVAKKYAQIEAMNREIRTRKQCGFKQ